MAAILPAGVAQASARDAELLRLGREFLRLASALDALVDKASPHDGSGDQNLDRIMKDMDVIEEAILRQRATTVRGLRAKALVVNWAKCDDLNPDDIHYLADRMMLSLVQDLLALSPGISSDPPPSEPEAHWV
jgi:hypothetical protein